MTKNTDPRSSFTNNQTIPTDIPAPDENDLTVSQLQILEMIKEQPDASQQDFSDQLDISPSAISNCMRDVPGFTWKNRKKFVRKFYGDGVYDGEENNSDVNGAPDDGEEAELDEISEQIQTLQEKCASLSERVDELEQMNGEAGVTDPDVIRKVVLTLDNSDRFTEEEKNLLLDKWHGK